MLEDVVANVEEWKRSTATKQDIAILSLKIDELKAAQEIREANLTGAQSMPTKFWLKQHFGKIKGVHIPEWAKFCLWIPES